jgi:hypothetical protein
VRIVRNLGRDRIIDLVEPALTSGRRIDLATASFSIYAFAELAANLQSTGSVRLLLPDETSDLGLLGGEADRAARNRLNAPWLASECLRWLESVAELRGAGRDVPQGALIVYDNDDDATQAFFGSFTFTTAGLGITPGNPLSLVQASETPSESRMIADWFAEQWRALGDAPSGSTLIGKLLDIARRRDPMLIYAAMLGRVFQAEGGALDHEEVVRSATGIRNTVVWNKLYKFQRDGVVGAIDKLERFGGCIIADSVGLGKTFEALAVIKYHELRNDRVLVLCPKRLRDNWTQYRANDRRNVLASDRFNYDVLNHTDLSRDGGLSGDIDLAHINWGNYDLVVIDESHNFRNKQTPRQGGETRYDRLMRRIIEEGVKTRVLMLSATPVNNRLADLRNQIAFATAGADHALAAHGVPSIDATTRMAQKQFNQWLRLEPDERTPARLVKALGFDYFKLLDLLTIARSRKHLERYYGTSETGDFPARRPPINVKPDLDLAGAFPEIRDINREIRRLTLAAYAPLRYVLPHKQAEYDALYSTQVRGGEGFFRQADREESLIHLLRVNVLKRLESAVSSFALTVGRQLESVQATLDRLDEHESVEEVDIRDVDIDDPIFESLLVGRKVKVLLQDVDAVRWRQDLLEDRNRLQQLLNAARQVTAERDAKLAELRRAIAEKSRTPLNPGNRKVLVFTAFADTARYLYDELAPWAHEVLGINTALVTGTGGNETTLDGLRRDQSSILTAFSPRSKERPEEFAAEGEIDLLIATDCVSEGQNLQDCDWLVNYDMHWNPVRIIQRFGRIDRIGSPNSAVQLVNFWPNMELEEYINLEQRVAGRMVLLDVSATGEENLIEQQAGDPMNDLQYRREQLLKLQDQVIDLEDLSSGISITDLTLGDYRIDLSEFAAARPDELATLPLGASAVVTSPGPDVPPGTIFCLEAQGTAAELPLQPGYPLAPYYLVHVGTDGEILVGFNEVLQVLGRLKAVAVGRESVDPLAASRLDAATYSGRDMSVVTERLASAVRSLVGESQQRVASSLFNPGGTQAGTSGAASLEDFEVISYLTILEQA